MSALEKMLENVVKGVLKSYGQDLDVVKSAVTSRIEAFEKNVTTLNTTLIGILETQARHEKILMEISSKLGLQIPSPPNTGTTANDGQQPIRDALPALSGTGEKAIGTDNAA